jgi:O-antigen ligase
MTRRERSDTFWTFLLLLLSGNPVFYQQGGGETLLPVAAVVFGLAAVARRARIFEPRVVRVIAALVAIQLVQCYEFQFWPVVTILGEVTRLFIAAAAVALVDDFPAAYVRAIMIIAVYCLVMWTIDQTALAVGLDFRALCLPLEQTIGFTADHRFAGVYTFTVLDGSYRNAGFFREPGLFAGYLLLGLLWLVLDKSGAAPRLRRRRIAVMLAALLTTFSTAGYVTIPLVFAAVAFHHGPALGRATSRKTVFVAVLAASLGGLWLVSENTNFLEDKILAQYGELIDEGKNYEITRFGAALLDLEAIQDRPIFGWGLHESTKFAQTPELAELAPSGGVTGWARSFGLVGLAVFLLAVWAGIRPLVGGNLAASVYATALIVVIAQPNTFLNYPAFFALMFLRRPRAPGDTRAAQSATPS